MFSVRVFVTFVMSRSFFNFQGCLLAPLLLLIVTVHSEECNKFTQCKGPIWHYEDLKCKPIYENPGDCCAIRYDCSHLNNRSSDKCYANGREYSIDEPIKDEDKPSPCDVGCICKKGFKNEAEFTCAVVDCPYEVFRQVEEGCSLKFGPNDCCGKKLCSKSEDVVKCEVDGKNYTSGERFYPEKESDLSCVCMEGYKGENVAPFCRRLGCGVELRRSSELRSNCAPVFYDFQTPQTSCSISYRCQNDNDSVINSDRSENHNLKEASEEMMCKFGNMTMHIGDELNQATNYDSVCVKCVCEVPPTPTCQRLPESDCDVTKHAKFD